MQILPKKRTLLVAGLILLVFLPATKATDKLASSDITQPEFFPILPWDPLEGWDGKAHDSEVNGLESIAECHFNMAGFVRPKHLPKCRKLGLGAFLLPSGDGVLPLKYQSEWKNLADEEINSRIRAMVKAGGSNIALRGYFIMDEPGLSDFPALGKAVAAVKKYAPGKLAYINLFPDYATLGAPDRSQLGTTNYTEYLERFIADVKPQLLSYDNYMVQYSDDLQNRSLAASYFRNMLEVRRVAQEHHLPYLHIVAANQLQPKHPIPSPANLLLQAYTTLAAGFRGVTWYTFYGRGYQYAPIDAAGNKTPTWSCLREVNRQVAALAPVLCRLSSTGVFFSSPPVVDGLPLLPGQVIDTVTCSSPLMVGEFKGRDAETYALLVNLNLEHSANLSLKTKSSGANLKLVSAVDGALLSFEIAKDGFWLMPGQGILLKVGE
ncbi:MAG TPA: hypothetical protein VN578_00600 [Candidatus Binatia bacterium]|jgi:hypothetical protein|nr:hypothetical protein [Candidatus Binatia bacterium]